MSWKQLVAGSGAVVLAAACSVATESPTPAPLASPSTTPSATLSPTASPATSPIGTSVTYDSPILGYRLSLPAIYRRVSSTPFTGPGFLGRDIYTRLTEEEQRAECLRDLGDIPSQSTAALLFVETYPGAAAVSVTQWVNTPRVPGGYVLSMHRRVEQLTIGGREAVRLVADNATADLQAVVIRGDERFYVITPTMWVSPPLHPLDAIAATFVTITPQPLPSPTPTAPPAARLQAATSLAQALARAFAASDADAVGRLTRPCHLGVSALIDDQPLANSGGGGLSRSVAALIQGLRERFAKGDLSVTVDAALRPDSDGGLGRYVVRSMWREPDRTVPVDLILDETDGGWRWIAAIHHYTRADLINSNCIPYRSPWVATTSTC